MADYHIDNITTIEHEDYGKLIRVSASPYEDTPLGYCYVINKAKKFYYPYSQRQINLLEQYEERNDYDVNLEFFTPTRIGLLHVSCFEQNSSDNSSINPIDLGLSVIWSDRNIGASEIDDYGIMSSFDEFDESAYSGWRIPTAQELEELINKCRVTAYSARTRGCQFKSNNGHSILMPSAGCAIGSDIYRKGQWGEYLGTVNSRFSKYCKMTVAIDGTPFVSYNCESNDLVSIRLVRNK